LNLEIGLVGTRGDINLGSIARLCANFSVSQIHLVDPQNPFSGQEVAFACHGKHLLESIKRYDSVAELAKEDFHFILGTTGKLGKDRPAVAVHELEKLPEQVFESSNRVLLLFGRECRGLFQEELAHCHATLHVSLPGEYPILNLSHAVSIILYEFQKVWGMRNHVFEKGDDDKPAPSSQMMAFLASMQEFLDSFNYYDKKERYLHPRYLEMILRRYHPRIADLRFLQGFLQAHKLHRKGIIKGNWESKSGKKTLGEKDL